LPFITLPVKSRVEFSEERSKTHQEELAKLMTRLRTFALLLVVAHWAVAIWHLFLAANVLPAPNNSVSRLAVVLLTLLHGGVSIGLWKINYKFIGWVSLIFFLAALGADLYEHFVHASGNNVFMVAPGHSAVWFNASVSMLLALEILGCSLGVVSLGGWTRKQSTRGSDSNLPKQSHTRFSCGQFDALMQPK
jgi:hypothetical protein